MADSNLEVRKTKKKKYPKKEAERKRPNAYLKGLNSTELKSKKAATCNFPLLTPRARPTGN